MISLCMIVKNESEFLENCLQSANKFFDDIVVVDTGSDDNTQEIARTHGAKLFSQEWNGDFSTPRNFAANYAKNDWIFVLDADEKIIDFKNSSVIDFIKDSQNIGSIQGLNVYDKSLFFVSRLYNKNNYEWSGRIHEQIVPKRNYKKEKIIKSVPIIIEHYGYSPEVLNSKNKLQRNEELLLKELKIFPNDPYMLYQLGKSYFSLNRDLEKAVDYFRLALAQKPDPKLDYVYSLVECLGYALINSGRFKEALEINAYKKFYFNKESFRFLLAHIYQNNGFLPEAVELFESCISEKHDDSDLKGIKSFLSYYNIGVILECVGMKEDAARIYLKCGDFEKAQKRLAEL